MIGQKTRDLFGEASEMWGDDFQHNMLIEECAELITKIRHYDRGRIEAEPVIEEIADVMILCLQFANRHNMEAMVDIIMMNKLERLRRRVDAQDPNLD